jgi:hypothetical protein
VPRPLKSITMIAIKISVPQPRLTSWPFIGRSRGLLGGEESEGESAIGYVPN